MAASLALQDRVRQVRDARIPRAVREARATAEADLTRTRRLLAVMRSLPAWDNSDTDRALENRSQRQPGAWDKAQYDGRPVLVPNTTLEGA